MFLCLTMWFAAYKVYSVDPGCLDERNPETVKYRKLYEETIQNLGEEMEGDAAKIQMQRVRQLCHTCHIVRPIRSKHCRIARRCVLLFDHYCPFVGATIGLYNYPWFYLDIFSMTACAVCFYGNAVPLPISQFLLHHLIFGHLHITLHSHGWRNVFVSFTIE